MEALLRQPGNGALVFPAHDGALWDEGDWKNWRHRIFALAAKAAGLENGTRPYDLRHSFVSLLLAEGRSPIDVARQAGHSPTMTLNTYAHVIDGIDPAQRISAERAIRQAREKKKAPESTGAPGPSTMVPIGSASTGRTGGDR